MLSALAPMLSSESGLGNPFPSFENGFTPWDWDCSDLFADIQPLPSPNPVDSNSGSEETNRNQTQNQTNSNSGSEEPPSDRAVSIVDERKLRRMLSNRESARRSRMRKQRHLENLRNQVNRLRMENRELGNRLRFVLYHCHRVRSDNDRLRSEQSTLRHKLSEMRQNLMLRQLQLYSSVAWPCNTTPTTLTTEQIPSLTSNHLI